MLCMKCQQPLNLVEVKEDCEEEGTCDTCGGLAVETPGLGWICIKTGQILVDIDDHYLYHQDTIVWWRKHGLWRF